MPNGASDRILGAVVLVVALAYVASATQIRTSFLSDPVGPRSFPIAVGLIAALASVWLIVKPDADPEWPRARTFGALAIATFVLVAYAYALKPLGFLVPTAIAAGLLSFQIHPNWRTAALSGIGLSVGLFVLFRFALGLSLLGFPRGTVGF